MKKSLEFRKEHYWEVKVLSFILIWMGVGDFSEVEKVEQNLEGTVQFERRTKEPILRGSV